MDNVKKQQLLQIVPTKQGKQKKCIPAPEVLEKSTFEIFSNFLKEAGEVAQKELSAAGYSKKELDELDTEKLVELLSVPKHGHDIRRSRKKSIHTTNAYITLKCIDAFKFWYWRARTAHTVHFDYTIEVALAAYKIGFFSGGKQTEPIAARSRRLGAILAAHKKTISAYTVAIQALRLQEKDPKITLKEMAALTGGKYSISRLSAILGKSK